ncbi:MAG: beta-lactamase family protein [Holophagales bacterium]|nr:beta-lactamase family protein [Holophagales bacterium]
MPRIPILCALLLASASAATPDRLESADTRQHGGGSSPSRGSAAPEPAPAEPGSAKPGLPEEVARQAELRIEMGFHLGTVIGVLDREGARYFGFGRISPTDAALPDEHSIFEIGSITKTFTATLLADLDLRGEMDLESPVSRYLPGFRRVLARGGPITLETLATHTAGLPREPPDMDPDADDRYATYTAEKLDALLAGGTLEAEVGTYHYSNLGVLVLERAVEAGMGVEYEALIRDRISGGLGMVDTYFVVPDEKRARLVTGFRNGRPTAALDLGRFPSMGGLRSTAADMLTYLGAQVGLERSPLAGAMAATQRLRYSDAERAVGLGWNLLERKESGKTLHFHKGGTNGFVSFAGFDVENRKAVVVLVNGRQWFSDLGFHLLDSTYPLVVPE